MRIGVPKEIKPQEYRVGLTPAGVRELLTHGHEVEVQSHCGAGVGFEDEDYRRAGATVVNSAGQLFENAQLIVKVKEPQAPEIKLLNPSHTVFGFFHLAATPDLAKNLLACGATCIAYETVTDDDGGLPLLTPMSEVAGRVAVQVGARFLEEPQGGMGILLGGVPGVSAANVMILGGGVAGTQAAHMALGLGARVDIVDKSLNRLRELDMDFNGRIGTHFSTQQVIEELLTQADLVIGAVLLPGASAPKLVSADMIKQMKKGSVIVDIAIDQGGCFETSKPTTHQNPVFQLDGVSHYCVTNMPSAVARTATLALTNATLPYVLELANLGVEKALRNNRHLGNGVNIAGGQITHTAVAKALGYP
jgi:alanine dehydrogenase